MHIAVRTERLYTFVVLTDKVVPSFFYQPYFLKHCLFNPVSSITTIKYAGSRKISMNFMDK